jgi:hypothetical protein
LQRGGGSIMLQEFRKDATLFEGKLGEGVSICFMCEMLWNYTTSLSQGE